MRSLWKIPTRLRGTNFSTSSARFAPSFVRQPTVPNAHKWYKMHQNVSLGSNGLDRLRSLQKILMRLRGMNFSTSSVCFATSFVRQPMVPNAHKWYKTHKKVSLGSNGLDRLRSLRKIPKRLRGMNFCTSSARFAPNIVSQPNNLQCTKIVWKAPKYEFRVQWDGSDAFIAKNSDATSWHELLYQFGPFCTKFRKSTKRSPMHQNSTKCTRIWV